MTITGGINQITFNELKNKNNDASEGQNIFSLIRFSLYEIRDCLFIGVTAILYIISNGIGLN